MKNKVMSFLLAAALLAILVVVPAFDSHAANDGSWINGSGGWWYQNGDGSYAWNEWRDGYWLSSDGYWTYKYTGAWYQNSKGWWFQDTSGWYPSSTYQWINGVKYKFNGSGYLEEKGWCYTSGGWYYVWGENSYAQNEWVDGYWIGADQYWTYQPTAKWYKDSVGYYYKDSSGWYPKNETVRIDGKDCTFDNRGYLKSEEKASTPSTTPSQTAKTTYTQVTPKGNASAEFTFAKGTDANATEIEGLLKSYTKVGASKAITINGNSVTITHTNDGIVLSNKKTIADYITKGGSATVTFNSPLSDLVNSFNTSGSGSYSASVTCLGTTFSNIKANGATITFSASGTPYTAEISGSSLLIKGDHTADTWLKNLSSAVSSTTIQK